MSHFITIDGYVLDRDSAAFRKIESSRNLGPLELLSHLSAAFFNAGNRFVRPLLVQFEVTGSVRPTAFASAAARARYEAEAEHVCKVSMRKLEEIGFSRADIVRIMPVTGCHEKRFWPKITHSEVIAVLMSAEAVRAWSETGRSAEKMLAIVKTIQSVSEARAAMDGHRTYVIAYVAANRTLPSPQEKNELYAINFNFLRHTRSSRRELRERTRFVRSLQRIHSVSRVWNAMMAGDPNLEGWTLRDPAAPIASVFEHETLAPGLRAVAWSTLAAGALGAAGFVTGIFSAIFGQLSGHTSPLLIGVGVAGAILLYLASEFAGQIDAMAADRAKRDAAPV